MYYVVDLETGEVIFEDSNPYKVTAYLHKLEDISDLTVEEELATDDITVTRYATEFVNIYPI